MKLPSRTVLDAYSRVVNGTPRRWLSAFRHFIDLPEVSLQVPLSNLPLGDLSLLPTREGIVLEIQANMGYRIQGISPDAEVIVGVLEGEVHSGEPDNRQCKDGQVFHLPPQSPRRLNIARDSHALVAVLPARHSTKDELRTEHFESNRRTVERLMSNYYQQAQQFAHHKQTLEMTTDWLSQLQLALTQPLGSDCDRFQLAPVDDRVIRMLEFLHDSPPRSFDLEKLAQACGCSERNLYYLARTHTGMTPYHIYTRLKILQCRARLVADNDGPRNISWHASENGFGHLGRFARLYRQHCGENPRDTIAWLNRLDQIHHSEPQEIISGLPDR